MATRDLTGMRFGRLEIIGRVPNKGANVWWSCRCQCGTTKDVRASSLISGVSRSCGCLSRELSSQRNGRHWLSRDCATTPSPALYSVWQGMRQRCNSPQSHNYSLYGARGIKIADEWREYPQFYEWALRNGYATGMSLDRIDVNGDYAPSNCRWTTAKEQSRNRRNTAYILVNGKRRRLQDLNEHFGINHANVLRRLRKGADPAAAHAALATALGGVWGRDGIEISDNTIADQ
jgi:hypothetical protein